MNHLPQVPTGSAWIRATRHSLDVPGRERIFVQYDGNAAPGNFQRCVVEKGYKLAVDRFKEEQFMELYGLDKDPQINNLAFDPRQRDRMLTMLRTLENHVITTGEQFRLSPVTDYEKFLSDYIEYRR
jgi:hypothetical protein